MNPQAQKHQNSAYRQMTLEDSFTLDKGFVFMSGTQALARLPLMQRQRDLDTGLDTCGFISGYRGSPLAGYDMILARIKHLLDAQQISFLPAINEELAATAIIGTQQVAAQPDVTCDGVFSLWYGKGPGLDRAGDALKHANSMGSTPNGGALVVVGDDHNAISSAMAHQSEQLFASWMMPVLHASNIAEILDFGLLGWAMSRFSGCYVGLKIESEIIESAASVYVDNARPKITLPEFDTPPGGLHYRWPYRQLDAEARLQDFKLPAALAFAQVNPVDRVVWGSPDTRFGIITTGKAYLTVRQALTNLGIDEARAHEAGLGIYKVGMPWPLETHGARRFAAGLDEVLVIEEKRSFIEGQLKEALFDLPESDRPRVVGKSDEHGKALLPGTGILSPGLIARVITKRWPGIARQQVASDFFTRIEQQQNKIELAGTTRTPFYCSGCPHNRSTATPKGSRVLAGTGCHLMAVFMDRDTSGFLHMGAEGANWAGQAPFCKTGHMFQNLGDGTYTHSGSLAIRQAVAAGVNITYRILYNDAVAMTGGQVVDGNLSVPQVTRQLHAEGVRRIAVLSDEPGKYSRVTGFAPGVSTHDRDELEFVEKELSGISGVTALIYDQICAAEKRRRKRREKALGIETRLFINEAVCEGCGDCVKESNCLSVIPMQTDFGVKRQIDQSSCNIDMSCLRGFCPSFISITGARPATILANETSQLEQAITNLPQPRMPDLDNSFDMVVTGIGGQGVVTIGRIVGMAAHLQGLASSVLDFPGLAQKGGGVMSYIRLNRRVSDGSPDIIQSSRVPLGKADLLLAGDMVTALDRETIGRIGKNVTRAIVNTHVSPTGGNVLNPDSLIDASRLRDGICDAVGNTEPLFINATRLSEKLAGDTITANMLLLGYAWQAGAIPISADAINQAIRLNGAGSDTNTRCFDYGRLAAHDPELMQALTGIGEPADSQQARSLDDSIVLHEKYLTDYQNPAYARRYRCLVDIARQAESQIEGAGQAFSRAVAGGFFQTMAYKDEYEVARLHTSKAFTRQLQATISGKPKITYHLAPPFLTRRDSKTGKIRKIAVGPWIRPFMMILARFKFLRGTVFDIFGYTRERRDERARIDAYERLITGICTSLSIGKLGTATEIAALAMSIRGYGHIKERTVIKANQQLHSLRLKMKEIS